MLADPNMQQPEVNFKNFDIEATGLIGGTAEDKVESTAIQGETLPAPVGRQFGEQGELKA